MKSMQIKVNGDKNDLSAMLLSAERYALGRQTYIVDWTCEFIANNLDLILDRDKKVMIRDIGVRIDIWTHFMRECIINYVH